jgi:aspartate/methionine/tyrosine aminotransferase
MLYEINEKALKLESEGKKIIRLNLGDPDMATPPEIVEAAYAKKSLSLMALNQKTS